MLAPDAISSETPGTAVRDESPHLEAPDAQEAQLQVLLAEFEWVAGLIRYYREVELKALGATGLVLSAVAAAYAALESGTAAAQEAEGHVFAGAACVPAFLVPVVLMANMRGLRAVVYVREWLRPLACELTGDRRYLAWEMIAQKLLVAVGGGFATGVTGRLVSAAPVLMLVAGTSVLLGIGAWTIHPTDVSRAVGTVAGLFAIFFAIPGLRFATGEQRDDLPDSERARIVEALDSAHHRE